MLMLAIPAVLVLGACSSDDDDEPDLTVPDLTLPDVTIPDITVPDLTIPDITIPDITIPDITIPDLTVSENIEETVRDALAQVGLDDTQIDCVVEQLDLTAGQVPDVNDIVGVAGDCDIEISDLQPGG
jgi:hypothetical protein